jgi:hypothetical protein
VSQIFVVTLTDIIGVAILACVLLFGGIILARIWIAQWLCRHDAGCHETRSCDAICNKCGKNLGFIGTLRSKDPK